LVIGFCGIAQKQGQHHSKNHRLKDLNAEQIATLRTKKMTLALDLTPKQFEAVMQLNIENATFHKEKMAARSTDKGTGEKPLATARYDMANARLDRQIAEQQQLKGILTDVQYALWKELKLERHAHGKKRFNERKKRG